MKIHGMSGYPVFRNNQLTTGPKPPSSQGPAKTDVASFSRTLAGAMDRTLTATASSVLTETAQPTSAKTLEALKEQVASGHYHRSTEEIVRAILGDRR